MKNVISHNKKYKKIFNNLYTKYDKVLTEEQIILMKSILYKLKKYTLDEYMAIFGFIYGLYLFKIIDINNDLINKKDKKRIELLNKISNYEISGDFDNYLLSIFEMEKDLLIFKMTIKSKIISFGEKYLDLIPNKKNFFKTIGYAIPFLTLENSKFLPLFHDAYFNFLYKEQYNKTKKFCNRKIKKIEYPGKHLNSIINELSDIMFEKNIIGKTKIRKKSYFSIYNKIKRKKHQNIYDILGIMIIFQNLKDLHKFTEIFEKKFIYIQKKDYIKKPKKNGYKSIHYKLNTMYCHKEIGVEIQIKTLHIEKKLEGRSEESHYNYTLNEKKWNHIFSEITYGHNFLKKYKSNN